MIIRYAHVLPVVVASILATACATIPNDPESQAKLAANLGPVQRVEPGDNQLACEDLASQIKQTQWDISALNLQIVQAQNASTGFAVLGALAGMSGAYANTFSQAQTAAAENVVANAGGAISGGAGMTKAAIQATYEARYESLVGLFNEKNCPPMT
jgi:hypothetical protein